MKKFAVLLIALIALTSFGFTFFPDEDNNPDELGPKFKVMQDLKLTDEQQSKFNDIRYAHQKQMIDVRAEIQKNRLEVKKMMDDNNITPDKLLKLTDANNNLRSKMHTSRINMWLDIYKILNKEQQEIWTNHFANMGERIGERMHDRMGQGKGMKRGAGMGQCFRDFDNDDKVPPRDGRGQF
ncbi:MAG: hypothetical protein A2068_02350 [Ignavibacteria bacterium GWB2_35_6b]|nr:MAG: hypothetical protein A2068_02350 [Ignavibacteria bacterium GWB2_35_6b]